MITIRNISDPDQKTDITLKIMHSLPKWFSPPEDIDNKSILHRDFEFYAAFDDDEPVGFVALKQQTDYTMDIYSLGVLEPYHRHGIGHQLIAASEHYCRDNSFTYLTVKTLDGSCDYQPYERTRNFYLKCGFIPLEVFPTIWDEQNPCLFLAKYLG